MIIRRENIFLGKEVPKDEGYGYEGGTMWRMIGYKYTHPTHGLDKPGASRFNLNSLSNGREWARASDVNPKVRGTHNNSLNPQKLKQPPSSHTTRKLKWRLHLESKRLTQVHARHNGKALRTPNDTYNINDATIAQKYKSKFKERSQPHYRAQALENRPRRWGANVVALPTYQATS